MASSFEHGIAAEPGEVRAEQLADVRDAEREKKWNAFAADPEWLAKRAETEKARLEAERQARQREFVAAFASAAPRPGWWDEVETPYRVAPLGGP